VAPTSIRRSCLVVALALVVLAVILDGSAFGAVAATQTVSNTSPSSSSNKQVSVSCPTGKKVLGAGTFVDFANTNQVLLDDLRPSADLTSVTVNGIEDDTGTTDNWTLTAAALCATPPPGLERVSATSALNSSNKQVTVGCPGAKRVLGAGADINSFNGEVILDDLRPNAALTSVTANAVEDETGNAFNWSVTAYAVCADPVAGLERISEVSPLDSSSPKILFPSCPSGKVMTGVGADINSFNGQVQLNGLDFGGPQNILLSATEDETGNPINWSLTAYVICAAGTRRVEVTSFANSDPKNENATCEIPGQQVTGGGGGTLNGAGEVVMSRLRPDPPNNFLSTAYEDDGGFAGDWQLRADAVCATPLPGQEIVSNTTPNGSSNRSVSVSCPGGKRVVGAAGEEFNGLGQVILDDVRPNSALTSVTVTGIEDQTGYSGFWTLTARAICATPPPGLERVSAVSALDSSPKNVTVSCPTGKNLLGMGYDTNTFNGEVLIDSFRPNEALTSVTVSAIEDVDGNAFNWSLTAYGICASP
jgi:hypothetical protein